MFVKILELINDVFVTIAVPNNLMVH